MTTLSQSSDDANCTLGEITSSPRADTLTIGDLTPVLSCANGIATDLDLFLSKSSNSYLLFLGVALLERINCSRESLEYKMMVGRQVNAGRKKSDLKKAFGHDYRTMRKWASALQSDDPEFIVEAFSGRGYENKLTQATVRYVKKRYLEIHEVQRNYRQVIMNEVEYLFVQTLSRESLRKIFRMADDEQKNLAHQPEDEEQKNLANQPEDEEQKNLANQPEDDENQQRLSTPEHPEATHTQHTEATHTQHPEATQNSPSLEEPSWSTTCPSELDSCLDKVLNDKQSTKNEPTGLLPMMVGSEPQPRRALHHSGQVLFIMFLAVFSRKRQKLNATELQWLGQILQGAVNIEQSRQISLADLGFFTGAIMKGTDPQRRNLHQLANLDRIIDIYVANNALLTDGPGRAMIFYYDPTSKKYTGMYNIMKGWCGSIHGITKLMYLDAIHTRSGRPCFIQHYTPYYDLRERFFMTNQVFNRLFPEDQRKGRTFVIDRGIYGIETFKHFAEVGDYLLTWEKDYQRDGWIDDATTINFRKFKTGNNARDLKEYNFSCQESEWSKMDGMRRFIVRATNPNGRLIQLSILCSNPKMDMEEAVWLMFNRWLQENNFKYLNAHFGLDQLTSYGIKDFDQDDFIDKEVDANEYKELKASLTKAENTWAKALLNKEKQQEKIDSLIPQQIALEDKKLIETRKRAVILEANPKTKAKVLKEGNALLRQLNRDIKALVKKIETAKDRLSILSTSIADSAQICKEIGLKLDNTLRKESKLNRLIANNFKRHDTRAKSMLDALRVTASNMFAALVADFRPLYGNHRNDHVMLRQLTRADGFVETKNGRTIVSLWLKGTYQKKQLEAFDKFLNLLSHKINNHFGSDFIPLQIQLMKEPLQS